MIYINKPDAKEKDFINLLEKSRELLLKFLRKKKDISPTHFETTVFEHTREAAKGTSFEGKVQQTGAHDFPDIIANKYFGVEVKMTTSDHWTSTGNSILESSRIEDVEKIYIMFGKFGGKLDIKFRLYQECLPDVSVTHSPRYRINMNLKKGESIFDKIGVDYDTLRKHANPIQKIKDHYRSKLKDGEELWWIDQENDDKAISPIIRPFRNLSDEEKENFIVESMILFPEMFGNSAMKYERAAAYLISEYNSVSASLRDSFTAGGQIELKIKRKTITVPQVAERMRARANDIKTKINELDGETLAYYWRIRKIERDRLNQWKKLLNKNLKLSIRGIKASDVFDSGL
ncbi:MAG: hypothetical protein COV70_03425 [Parcubacteria group bacterium CG11_big_fil_rev_8_21_14_0_20_39_22]|nr:MAG: hypothetical protein COV70_03425 [Parcubacteria group bacterium CG11_big_fil_rev_8_21_14_0_20_39_22]